MELTFPKRVQDWYPGSWHSGTVILIAILETNTIFRYLLTSAGNPSGTPDFVQESMQGTSFHSLSHRPALQLQ